MQTVKRRTFGFGVVALLWLMVGCAGTSSEPTHVDSASLASALHFFKSTDKPTVASWDSSASVELGLRFWSEVDGTLTGLRFYKGAGNMGTHTGSLWTLDGARLATVVFAHETASGWQSATFNTPVPLTAGTAYVISYFAPRGHYAANPGFFHAKLDNGVLHASTVANGLYHYGTSGFPDQTYGYSNYWVDISFVPAGIQPPPAPPPPPPTPSPDAGSSPPPNPAPGSGYPDATNTGVPVGTHLTPSGPLVVNTPGAVIDALDVSGTIEVHADNVTLKRLRIRGSGYAIVRVQDGVKGVSIQDCEIDGMGIAGGLSNSGGVIGPASIVRTNIYGVENGIVPGDGTSIQDSYIHDLGAPGDPHYDNVQIDSGANILIRHNTITNSFSQTSAIMIDNYFGPALNITVDNNRLMGGGYTIYVDNQFNSNPITGIVITNNRFTTGYWGYAAIKVPVTQLGNVSDATGAPLSL